MSLGLRSFVFMMCLGWVSPLWSSDTSSFCASFLRFVAMENRTKDLSPPLQSDFLPVDRRGRDSLQSHRFLAEFSAGLHQIIFRMESEEGEFQKLILSLPVGAPLFRLHLGLERHAESQSWWDGNLVGPVLEYLQPKMKEGESLEWELSDPYWISHLNRQLSHHLKDLFREERPLLRLSLAESLLSEEPIRAEAESFVLARSDEEVNLLLELFRDPFFLSELVQSFPQDDFRRYFDLQNVWDFELVIQAQYETGFVLQWDEEGALPKDLGSLKAKSWGQFMRERYGRVVSFSYRLLLKPRASR